MTTKLTPERLGELLALGRALRKAVATYEEMDDDDDTQAGVDAFSIRSSARRAFRDKADEKTVLALLDEVVQLRAELKTRDITDELRRPF